jgi:hypothetical protein
MSQLLNPHLTVAVDTEPFYYDLVRRYTSLGSGKNQDRFAIRKEIAQRCEDMGQWLVKHGYQCGTDYQQTESGYRFASDKLATFFRLAWS